MPTAITLEPIIAEALRMRWTRQEFAELSNGPFGDEDFELMDGDVISKMGKNRSHVHVHIFLKEWLVKFSFSNCLNRATTDFLHSNPQPEDLH